MTSPYRRATGSLLLACAAIALIGCSPAALPPNATATADQLPSTSTAPTSSTGSSGEPSMTAMATRPPVTSPAVNLPPTGPISPPPATDTSAVPAALLDAVLTDAAARADVPPDAITVIRAQAITWPNGALGCPVPGQQYTDALVPGYWIVVTVAGRQLDYRATTRGSFALCENPPGPG